MTTIRNIVTCTLAVFILLAASIAIPWIQTTEAEAAGGPVNWGANIAGLAMGNVESGEGYYRHGDYYGTGGKNDYRKNTSAEIAYLHSKGFDYHRVQFNWYRAQHELYGTLDATDIGYLNDVVTMITNLGDHCSIVPFDYGYWFDDSTNTRYALGTEGCPYSAFADFWKRMATHFKGKVWAYDLMNEPKLYANYPGNWFEAAQAAITAIRAVDTTTCIIVPGDGWSSTNGWYLCGNDALKNLVDPSNNLIFEGHQYFDGDTTGTYTTGDNFINAGTGEVAFKGDPEDRAEPLLTPFTQWCRANGKIGLIGETGTPGTDFWLRCLAGAFDYVVENDDAIQYVQMQSCWTWFWKDYYVMSIAPLGDPLGADNIDGAEQPQTLLMAEYLGQEGDSESVPASVAAFKSSGTWTCPAGVTSVSVLVVAGGGSGGYNIGGGGGAGGVIYKVGYPVTPGQAYAVVVGNGGAGKSVKGHGNNGLDTSFGDLTATGGGGGGSYLYEISEPCDRPGRTGGSGGGGGGWFGAGGAGIEGQGYDGGTASYLSGGGGGAGGVGLCINSGSQTFPLGGGGVDYSRIFGTGYGDEGFFGGGGGGCTYAGSTAEGGIGGGGDGSIGAVAGAATPATSGMPNTGGGGGGSYGSAAGASGAGGSGIVLIGYDLSSTNRAPVLNAIGNKAVSEGASLAFTISASDADGDTLTYSASNLPQGATFSPATRTFSWTPGYSQAGVYAKVHFEVSDGSLADTEDITMTVNGWYEQFTTSNAGTYVYSQDRRCQTFTPSTSHSLNTVSLYLYKQGAPTYTVTIAIYAVDTNHKPTGSALRSTTFAASSLTTRATWHTYKFSTGCQVSAGVEYTIVLSGSGGNSTNRVVARVNTSGGYSRGVRGYSLNGGTTWLLSSAQDMAFKEGQS
jgi:hypothetical protein